MTREATIRSGLTIRKNGLQYKSLVDQYFADMNGTKGPSPGSLTVSLAGVAVDFSELTTPALCRIVNYDTANTLHYGISDGTEFYPLGEIQAGESYVIRLSSLLGRSVAIVGTGSGTYDGGTYQLFLKADVAPIVCSVEAFDA